MRKTKSQKGITLIALIITIIVLLILAVVAISAVQNDGIIGYAKNARDEYEKVEVNENATLEGYLSKIEDNLPGNKEAGDSNSAKEVTKGVKVTGSNGIYIEKVGGKTLKAIIPVGFCAVKDIEGDSNTIERGLVISDVEDDDLANSKKGNQFVWIPVEDYSKFHLIEGYIDGRLHSMLNDLKEAGDSTNAGSPMANNSVAGTTESIAMYNSVKTNKGFYIARFEAGIDAKDKNGNPIDNCMLETKIAANGTVKPLSKKGIGVWNNIPWGGTEDDRASDGLGGNDNADGAAKSARSMYIKNNECGVTSTLCYGVQWDAVMNYIDPNYYEGKCSEDSFVRNSDGKGNYSGSLALTGAYEQNHIFDLAGNVSEWTMEGQGQSIRSDRGGDYYMYCYGCPSSYRYDCDPDYIDRYRRFPCGFVFVV